VSGQSQLRVITAATHGIQPLAITIDVIETGFTIDLLDAINQRAAVTSTRSKAGTNSSRESGSARHLRLGRSSDLRSRSGSD
jgi:hypothetical protein